MCGLLGIVTHRNARPSVDAPAAASMRDTMTRRGPDGAGLDDLANALFAHRRLAVIDPTPAGHQPMRTPDARFILIYNGELYNDQSVRAKLASEGVAFQTRCDTETVLWAVARWGVNAARHLRGMYALALLDTQDQTLTLARDPLGIKPLYTHARAHNGGVELVFASEPRAILAHPHITPEPDLGVLSAYLTTIRPTLGPRTLFAGLETLRPGEWRVYDLNDPKLPFRRSDRGTVLHTVETRTEPHTQTGGQETGAQLNALISDSITQHLRADVPVCCLLSGGLDSTIITCVARAHKAGGIHAAPPSRAAAVRERSSCTTTAFRSLTVAAGQDSGFNTYCAGAEGGSRSPDLEVARRVADWLGSEHTEAVVSRELFAARWPEMIRRTGLPLSTPNEVAINHIARTLRANGHVVALSGEGADELFGGYAAPMQAAADHVAALCGAPDALGGRFQLESNQWVPMSAKQAVLDPSVFDAIDNDSALIAQYESDFNALGEAGGDRDPLQTHLRFHRRVNLENLLARLDRATMLESVEGRTPLGDVAVGAHAEALPMPDKFVSPEPGDTKIALRRAFTGAIPQEVIERPKASFPLPFETWVGDCAHKLGASAFARAVFSEAAIETVAQRPDQLWSLAWPMLNIAMWGDEWWG